jgi:hypothetical protein
MCRGGKDFFLSGNLGLKARNFLQKIAIQCYKELSFLPYMKQYVFKIDKAHKIHPEVVIVVAVLQAI